MPIPLQWILASQNIRGNKERDIAAKEAIGWTRAKRKNGKWREWDSRHTAEKHKVAQAKVTIKLASKQKTCDCWEEVWWKEKTGRKRLAICPKPTKQILKRHKAFCKAAIALVVQMKTEKIDFNKFLYSRKAPGFDSLRFSCRQRVQSVKHIHIEC